MKETNLFTFYFWNIKNFTACSEFLIQQMRRRANSIKSKRIRSREQSFASNRDEDEEEDDETVHTCIISIYFIFKLMKKIYLM